MAFGYVVVDMQISDMEQYKQYMAAAPVAVAAFGGEYLVRGGRFEALEGGLAALPAWPCCAFPVMSRPRPSTTLSSTGPHVPNAPAPQNFSIMVLVEGVAAPV